MKSTCLIFSTLLCLTIKCHALDVGLVSGAANISTAAIPNNAPGPVSAAMENLAYNTASIADEISLQFNTKLESTANIISGHIEVLMANAMAQLATPIYDAERKLDSDRCEVPWSMPDLRQRIDLQLNNCTMELQNLLFTFKSEADSSASKLQQYVEYIAELPSKCQLQLNNGNNDAEATFASSTSCFVEKMANINQLVSKELEQISLLLTRARRQAREGTERSQQCTDELVEEVTTLLEETLVDC